MNSQGTGASIVCVCAALASVPALAQEQTFEYGMPFRTVRAAGNAAYPGGELFSNAGVGAVAYEYRIAEREVTTTEWLEFVLAYTPYYTGNPEVPGLNGNWIRYDFAPGQYHVVAGAEQYAADMSWRMAARFCNWLHNGKVNEAWAFESGAYDTSTFGFDNTFAFTDQLTHSPGARFWIPTRDEWFKATYFDPDRLGPNLPGYWLYPDGGNDPLVIGLPEEGGETSAGLAGPHPFEPYVNVGSYPHVRSPWGLLDVSGGVGEWLKDADPERTSRASYGTSSLHQFPEFRDRADFNGSGAFPFDAFAPYGLRIAATIPPPGTAWIFVTVATLCMRRRSR